MHLSSGVRAGGVRIDGFDLGVLCLFGALSVWVLGLDLWRGGADHRVWTGTDGIYVVDQLQYLAWIRDASRHVLVSNLFVLRSTPADYFQPAVAISGALVRLGLAPWLALLVWKPVAVLASFFAIRAYVRELLADRWARRAALVLALFYGSITSLYGSWTTIGDLFPGFLSWGYTFALLALALIVLALLELDRGRPWLAGTLAALAGLLHPWNVELLLVVVLVAALLAPGDGLRARALQRAAPVLALGAAPLLYYWLLGRFDPSWSLAREASKHAFPLWSILLELAPLLLAAAFALGRPAATPLAVANRVWPVAALAVFLLGATGSGATPLHAFQGITIPLSVLAVEGWHVAVGARHRRALAVALVCLLTVPATIYQLRQAGLLAAPRAGSASFITSSERRALDYLATDPRPGGVLARSYLGLLVPSQTGRHSYVGDCIWSEPDCSGRLVLVGRLFAGRMPVARARRFVLGSRARFLLEDCRGGASLAVRLGPILSGVHRFGCATVYLVR